MGLGRWSFACCPTAHFLLYGPVPHRPRTHSGPQPGSWWKWKSLSRVRLFVTPWNTPSMEFSRSEYWRGQPSLFPGDLPNPGTKPSLPYCRWILCQLIHKGSPRILEWVAYPFSRGSSNPEIELGSPALQADSSPTELSGKGNSAILGWMVTPPQKKKDKYLPQPPEPMNAALFV